MDARELADLPFAAALTPHRGGLAAGEVDDGVHFDQLSFDELSAASSRFIECAFTGVSLAGGQLRKARFRDVWLRDVRLVGTGLAQTMGITVSDD